MKNNVIRLDHYNSSATEVKTAREPYRSSTLRNWIETVTETVFTLTICGCSLFCVYLAFTML